MLTNEMSKVVVFDELKCNGFFLVIRTLEIECFIDDIFETSIVLYIHVHTECMYIIVK